MRGFCSSYFLIISVLMRNNHNIAKKKIRRVALSYDTLVTNVSLILRPEE